MPFFDSFCSHDLQLHIPPEPQCFALLTVRYIVLQYTVYIVLQDTVIIYIYIASDLLSG